MANNEVELEYKGNDFSAQAVRERMLLRHRNDEALKKKLDPKSKAQIDAVNKALSGESVSTETKPTKPSRFQVSE